MGRVIIVGGGFAGLSAAYVLMRRGVTPLLLEAKERAGVAEVTAGELWARTAARIVRQQ